MPNTLKTTFNRRDSLAIIIGIVIGVGIFRVPDEVALYLDSPLLILLAWLAGGLISLLGVLCFAELSSTFPETGGNYVYLKKSFGPAAGFLFGWAQLLVIRTGSIAAVAFIFSEYVRAFCSLSPGTVKPIAVSAVLILSIVNILGVSSGKRLQNVLSAAKVLSLCVLIIFGFLSQKGDVAHLISLPDLPEKGTFILFGLALIPILWTYGGWEESTFVAGETIKPGQTLPSTLISGICIVTLLYVLFQGLCLYLLPLEAMKAGTLMTSSTVEVLFGTMGKKVLEGLIILFSLGAINGMIITGSRITYAMGRDHAVFRFLGTIDPRFTTPLRSIVVNGCWAIVLIISGAFNQLLFFTGITIWVFFGLTSAGLIVLRRKYRDQDRPYRVWGYPLVPVLFTVICFILVLNTAVSYFLEALIGLCLIMIGIPVYLFSRKK